MNTTAAAGSPADRARPPHAANPGGATRPDADAAATQRVAPPAQHQRGWPGRPVPPPRVSHPAPPPPGRRSGPRVPGPGPQPSFSQPSTPQQTPWWIQRPTPPISHAIPARAWSAQPSYWLPQSSEHANTGTPQFTGPVAGVQLDMLWPGKHAFALKQPRPVPHEIQKSFLLWVGAAGLTAALMIVSVFGQLASTGGSLGGPFVLMVFGAALLYGAAMMRQGHSWARILNLVLGFIASWILLSCLLLIGGIFTVLSAAASTGYDLPGSTSLALLISVVSGLAILATLAAIITATVCMFKRPANEYLSTRSRA